jgi:hypothetical protein
MVVRRCAIKNLPSRDLGGPDELPSAYLLSAKIAEMAELRARAEIACEDARLLRYSQRRMLEAIREELALCRSLRSDISNLIRQRRLAEHC